MILIDRIRPCLPHPRSRQPRKNSHFASTGWHFRLLQQTSLVSSFSLSQRRSGRTRIDLSGTTSTEFTWMPSNRSGLSFDASTSQLVSSALRHRRVRSLSCMLSVSRSERINSSSCFAPIFLNPASLLFTCVTQPVTLSISNFTDKHRRHGTGTH